MGGICVSGFQHCDGKYRLTNWLCVADTFSVSAVKWKKNQTKTKNGVQMFRIKTETKFDMLSKMDGWNKTYL